MTTEKMNVHKALIELKTLSDRIESEMDKADFVYVKRHCDTKINGVNVDTVINKTKSTYQKINDLISRRNAIKRAVILSNATTKVTVGGEEYTVAEAIDMKDCGSEYLVRLKSRIVAQTIKCENKCEKENGDPLMLRADNYIINLFGSSDMKKMSDEATKVRNEFIEAQTFEVVDPIHAHKTVEELSNWLDKFLIEVDSALSVSNAITELEITY